jgi:hypothetical protein
MLVKMNHEEMVEACTDWLKKVYGLEVKNRPNFEFTRNAAGTAYSGSATFPEVERPEAKKPETPYRG